MPEVESRIGANSVDEVLADFDRLRGSFDEVREVTGRLIEVILKVEEIAIHSVQARVKSREKLRYKYCKSDKDYKCLGDISDLIGLRIITFYSDKLDVIAAIIAREFEQRAPLEDKRVGDLDSFGYSAIHMDCAYSPERKRSTEYRRYANARFEIQITTILGHAWAEMHHPWYDEFNSPPEEVRRFHRLAAVLELAEQEFLDIRRKKEQRELSASVRVAAKTPGTPITPESLKALIEQSELVIDLDRKLLTIQGGDNLAEPKATILSSMATLVNAVGIDTIQALEDQLRDRGNGVIEFVAGRRVTSKSGEAKAGPVLPKGLCILQLTVFLASTLGPDRYKAFAEQAHLSVPEDKVLDRQVAIAQAIDKARKP